MLRYCTSLLFIGIFLPTEALQFYPRIENIHSSEECGEPLYLTPLIQAGRLDEARKLARVKFTAFGDVESYSGFLTVDPSHGSNSFFWYFPAEIKDPSAPVILWLQGGPGASSLFGLFAENGPFQYSRGKVMERRYSWTENNHVIYIDNPVGTGFSHTIDGFAKNETVIGEALYTALYQFFQLFPNLQKNEFYVTGESYAGKYVPAVCYTIHHKNIDAQQIINLKGFAIGNGLSDPINQLSYGPYLYQIGLVDASGEQQINEFEKKGIEYIKARKWMDAFENFDKLLNGDVIPYPSLFYNLTGYKFYFNYLLSEDTTHSDDFGELLKCRELRRALHVGNLTFHDGSEVELNMREDFMKSVAPWVGELLSHYRGVIYNGQLDIIVAYPMTDNYLRALNFSSAQQFASAPRKQWRVGGYLAGYAKTAGNLTQLLVRGAGHMVPGDQPKVAVDIIHRLTANKPFY